MPPVTVVTQQPPLASVQQTLPLAPPPRWCPKCRKIATEIYQGEVLSERGRYILERGGANPFACCYGSGNTPTVKREVTKVDCCRSCLTPLIEQPQRSPPAYMSRKS